jgi:hypothetical protein
VQRGLKTHVRCLGGLCGLVQRFIAEEAFGLQDLEPTDRVCGLDRLERRPSAPDASLVSAGTDAPCKLKPKFRPPRPGAAGWIGGTVTKPKGHHFGDRGWGAEADPCPAN